MSEESIESHSKTYIAIVEDDESLCRSLARLLTVSGYQPVTYLSAEEFLRDTKRPAFDCLVIDIQLSGMSGVELRQRLFDKGVNIPVIYLTAHEGWKDIQEKITTPYAAFLRKSAPGEVLCAAIESSIRKSKG